MIRAMDAMKPAWGRMAALAGLLLATAACTTYPAEPRYSTRPMPLPGATSPYAPPPITEAPPPATAPYEEIDGGALDAPSDGRAPPPPGSAAAGAYASGGYPAASAGGAALAYVVQPGDTISGVGRRFQTPVQTLIELNALGARADIRAGQRLVLPAGAVDRGGDPFATGPSPVGVTVSNAGVPPPPPPPASTTPARPTTTTPPPAPASTVALDWPLRGDILRQFGPSGMGVRNNGINIGAPMGVEVRASAAGRVGYVGDDLAGQGLTVLIVHRDGWRTVYSHLGSSAVRDGQDVSAGQVIGTVGNTAGDGRPSIHFETWRMRGDEPVALDPLAVLPR